MAGGRLRDRARVQRQTWEALPRDCHVARASRSEASSPENIEDVPLRGDSRVRGGNTGIETAEQGVGVGRSGKAKAFCHSGDRGDPLEELSQGHRLVPPPPTLAGLSPCLGGPGD